MTFSGSVPQTLTGSVEFFSGSTLLGTVPVTGGQAQLSIVLPGGTNSLVAQYSGDTNFAGSTSPTVTEQVTKANTTTTLSDGLVGSTTTYGDPVTLTATVASAGGPAPTGTVTFTDGSTTLGSATVAGGQAVLSLATLPGGSAQIVASYGGDNFSNDSASSTLTVTVAPDSTSLAVSSDANPAIAGSPVHLTATVTNTSGTGLVPTGTVTFAAGSTVIGSAPVNGSGQAVVTWTAPPGDTTTIITANFTSNPAGNFAPSAGSLTEVSTKVPTQTVLTGSGQITPGTPFQLQVAVNWNAFPGAPHIGGTAVISDGAGHQCTAVITDQFGLYGAGTCDVTMANVGSYRFTATYSGDGTFDASVSGTTTVTVVPGPSAIQASVTLGPTGWWVIGQQITVSWSVTGAPAGSGGTVTVSALNRFGPVLCTSTSLVGSCSITVSSNVSLPTPYLLGSGQLYLLYSGSSNYSASQTTVTGTVAVCAPFNPQALPAGAGTLTTSTPPNCGSEYLLGSTLAVSETPNPGYAFLEWSDGETAPQINVTFNGGPTYASFTVASGHIAIGVAPGDAPYGQVFFQSQGTCFGQLDRSCYVGGTSATVVAQTFIAADQFYGWTLDGSLYSTNPQVTVPGGADHTLLANFGPTCDTTGQVTFATSGPGTVSGTPPVHDCNNPFAGAGYIPGSLGNTPITATASTSGPNYFSGWTWNGGSATTTVPGYANFRFSGLNTTSSRAALGYVAGGGTLTANFSTCVQLSTSEIGDVPGPLSVSPDGSCPTMGPGWYAPGTQITVLRPSGTQRVAQVRGAVTADYAGGGDPGFWTFTLNGNQSFQALFYDPVYCAPLGISVNPPGSADFSYKDSSGLCPTGTYGDVNAANGQRGGSVTFSLTPHGGHPLTGIDVATHRANDNSAYGYKVFGSQRPILYGPSSATAWICEGVTPQVTLVSPNGTAHTSSPPAGTDFLDAFPPPNCPIAPYAWTVGTIVTFGALAPSASYTFEGFDGATSGANPNPFKTVLLDGSQQGINLTADYGVNCGTLTFHATEVSDDHLSLQVPPNCPDEPASANRYIVGSQVPIFASDAGNHNFDGWGGTPQDNDPSFNPAFVTINGDMSVTAYYSKQSAGQVLGGGFKTAGNYLAGTAKQVVGVLGTVAGTLVQGPLGIFGGVAAIVDAAGAKQGWLDDIAQTMSFLTSSMNCANAWAEATPPDPGKPPQFNNVTAQLGKIGAAGIKTNEAYNAYQEAQAEYLALQKASASLNGTDTGALYAAQAARINEGSWYTGYQVSTTTEEATNSVLGSIGIAVTVGFAIYQMAKAGSGVKFNADATQAWTTGGDAYQACLDASIPSYVGAPPLDQTTASSSSG